LFLSLVLGAFGQTAQEFGAVCSLCNLLVTSISGYVSKTVTKQDLLNTLTSVSNEVCPKMPADLITPEQCSSFISLYGPYTVDMILSQTDPSQICGVLKLCDSSSDGVYTVLYPTIDQQNEQVTYTYNQKDVSKEGQKFMYRIFLGSPSFLDQETLTVALSENDHANFHLLLSNKIEYSSEVDCIAQSGTDCSILVGKPGRGVWYYMEVTAKSFLDNNVTEFILTATVQNEVITNEGAASAMRHKAHVIPIFLPILVIALCLLCCCLCVRRRRACKRYCQRRKEQQQQQESKEVQVAVDMQDMSQQMPMMYYYTPNGQMGYMPVPMQSMPQPVFVPFAQPE